MDGIMYRHLEVVLMDGIIMDRGKAVSVNGIGWQQVVFYYHIANIVFAFGRGLFKGFKKNLFLFKKSLS